MNSIQIILNDCHKLSSFIQKDYILFGLSPWKSLHTQYEIIKILYAVTRGFKSITDISMFTGIQTKRIYYIVRNHSHDIIFQSGRIISLSPAMQPYEKNLKFSIASFIITILKNGHRISIRDIGSIVNYIAESKDNAEREILKELIREEGRKFFKEKHRREILCECFVAFQSANGCLKSGISIYEEVLNEYSETIEQTICAKELFRKRDFSSLEFMAKRLSIATRLKYLKGELYKNKQRRRRALHNVIMLLKIPYVQNLINEYNKQEESK